MGRQSFKTRIMLVQRQKMMLIHFDGVSLSKDYMLIGKGLLGQPVSHNKK